MARIAGINLPSNKKVEIGLTYIFGIGQSLSRKILDSAKINLTKRIKDLTEKEVDLLKNIIEKKYKVEGELRSQRYVDIKRLKEIGCYRGTRHAKRLPARGQRSKTNSRTVRGNIRRTTGSGRKPSVKKV
ncbi:MAG: 30S ribosomal protein S13 [Ignavibacterium sp.]|nr:30S ribosomal protein S13 [Ignavibacterium sp.]